MTLLKDYAIDLLRMSNQDIDDFNNNPMEFINKMKDVTRTFYSGRHSALEMVLLICSIRDPKTDNFVFLREFFEFCVKSLGECSNDFKRKDALLLVIQSLSMLIKTCPTYHKDTEKVLFEYTMPGLRSEVGLERYRALKMYFEYSYFEFDQEHLMSIAEQVYNLIKDPEVPVKVTAAGSLYKLLKKPDLKSIFKPQLKSILETYFVLMNEIESEDLVSALEEVVSIFSAEIEPFAVELWEKLVMSYWRMMQAEEEDEDDFGENGLGAMSCITTIRKIFDSVKTKPELLKSLEQMCFKLFLNCTTPDGLESIDDMMACEIMMMYHWDLVSEELWSLLPHLVKIVIGGEDETEGGYGFEYFNCMIDYFRNIIRIGQDQLWTRKVGDTWYLDLIVKMIVKVVEISKTSYSDSDAMLAIRIINSLFEHLPGKIDNYLPHLLKIAVQEMDREDMTNHYILILSKCFFYSFYYNAGLTFQTLSELNALQSVMELWFGKPEMYKTTEDVNVVIFGTISIFKVNSNDIPQEFKSSMKQIVQLVVMFLGKYSELKNKNEDDAEGEDEEEEYKDIDDYDSEPDEMFDEEYLFGDSELNLYNSQLEKQESPQYFQNAMPEFQNSNPDVYSSLMELIPQ